MAAYKYRPGTEAQPYEQSEMTTYDLPHRSTAGGVQWVEHLPRNPAAVSLANAQQKAIVLNPTGWIARSSGDQAPYLEIAVSTTDATAGLQIEPWAMIRNMQILVQGVDVTAEGFNDAFHAYHTAWVLRHPETWAGTHGQQMGMVGASAVTAPGDNTAGTANVATTRTSPLATPPALTSNGVTRFILPLPLDYSVLSNSRKSFPLPLLRGNVEVRITFNPFTVFTGCGTAVAPNPDNLTLDSVSLWTPMFTPHENDVQEALALLAAGESDMNSGLIYDMGDVCVRQQTSLGNAAGAFNTNYVTDGQRFATGVEFVFRPADMTSMCWPGSTSVRATISDYRITIDGKPTTLSDVRCGDTSVEAYCRYLDFASAMCHEAREDDSLSMVPLQSFRLDARREYAAIRPLPYFAAVSSLVTSPSSGLASDSEVRDVNLRVVKGTSVGGDINTTMILYYRKRLLLTLSRVEIVK